MKPHLFDLMALIPNRKMPRSATLCAVVATVIIGDPFASAASNITWNSAGTGTWNTPANWSGGSVPGVGDSVFLTNEALGSTIAVNYSTAMSAASIGALTLGYGSAVSTAGDTVTLNISAGGFNTTATGTISAGGVLNVLAGGTYNNTASLVVGVLNSSTGLGTLNNTGGYLSIAGTTTLNSGTMVLAGGTTSFGGLTMTNPNYSNVIKITGGVNSLGNYTDGRSSASLPSTSVGLLISGGTTTAGSVVLGTSNSWGNMTQSGGSFTVTGNTFVLGQQATVGRGGSLTITGGTLTFADTTNGLVLANAASNTGTATFMGGVSSFGKITMIGSGATTGTSKAYLAVSGSGVLYIGSGGIVTNTGTATTASFTATGGTLGALADWSSAVQISTGSVASNTVTIQAADASGVAHNIVLNAGMSGSSGLIKTGLGTLTLGGTSILGTTTVNAGGIFLTGTATGGALTITGSTSSVNVAAGGSYTASSVTFSSASQSGTLSNSGGTLTVNGLTSSASAATPNGYTIVLSGGVTNFLGGLTIANNNTAVYIKGGTNSLGLFQDSRDSSGSSLTSGLIISGGYTTANGIVLGGGATGGQSYGNLNITGGTLVVSGSFIVGDTTTNANRGGDVNVSGGTLISTSADGIVLGNAETAIGRLIIASGTASFEKITLVSSLVTGAASARLYLTGGALYVGSGGIVANASGSSSIVATFGGTNAVLKAKADWSSTVPFVLADTATVMTEGTAGEAHQIILGGVLSGTGSLLKTGQGNLVLNGTNIYTGATMVSGGTLTLNGSLAASSAVSVNGATLAGSGTVGGTVTGTSATISGNGLTLGATTLRGSSTLSGYNIASSITVASGTTSLSGTTKSTSVLSVSAGATLSANGTINGSAAVSGLLKGNGTVTGNLSLTSGTLSPGNSHGIMTVGGNLTMDGASTLVAEVSGTETGTSYDQVQVKGNVSLAGTLDLTTLGGLTLGTTITLIDNTTSGTTSGYFATILTSGSTYAVTSNADYTFAVNGTEYLLRYTSSTEGDGYNNDVTLTVVPEPATWAMLVGGLGTLAFVQRRRFLKA